MGEQDTITFGAVTVATLVGGCGNTDGHRGYASRVADKRFTFKIVSAGWLADVLRDRSSAVLADLELDGVTSTEDGKPVVRVNT